MAKRKTSKLRRSSSRPSNSGAEKWVSHLRQAATESLSRCKSPDGTLRTAGDGPYADQKWLRDLALTCMVDPELALQILKLFFSHQKPNGELPYRIDGNYHALTYVLKPVARWTGWLTRRRKPMPIYRRSWRSWLALPVLDTTPAIILAFFQVYRDLKEREPEEARKLLAEYYPQLVRALQNDEKYRDPKDRLIKAPSLCDWMDDIGRKGKTCLINVLFYQAHRSMAALARCSGDAHGVRYHREMAIRMAASMREQLWDNEKGYFIARVGDSRLDAPANIFCQLYLATDREAIRIQQALQRQMKSTGFIRTFDRDYSWHAVRIHYLLLGFGRYSNRHLYPWVTHMNVIARLKLAERQFRRGEQGKARGQRFLSAARQHLNKLSVVHGKNEGFWEMLDGTHQGPARCPVLGLWEHAVSPQFAGTIVTYLAASQQLQRVEGKAYAIR